MIDNVKHGDASQQLFGKTNKRNFAIGIIDLNLQQYHFIFIKGKNLKDWVKRNEKKILNFKLKFHIACYHLLYQEVQLDNKIIEQCGDVKLSILKEGLKILNPTFNQSTIIPLQRPESLADKYVRKVRKYGANMRKYKNFQPTRIFTPKITEIISLIKNLKKLDNKKIVKGQIPNQFIPLQAGSELRQAKPVRPEL